MNKFRLVGHDIDGVKLQVAEGQPFLRLAAITSAPELIGEVSGIS